MSELIHLTKLSIARSRTVLMIAIAYAVVLHLGLIAYGMSGVAAGERAAVSISAYAIMLSLPLIGMTFAIFEFGDQIEVGSGATGYLPWLLRTPIKTWKLAAVPLALKTAWILAVCGTVAVTAQTAGMPPERWLVPAIGVATLFSLACLLTWQPFRGTYTRLAFCGISFVPAYAWLIYSTSFAFMRERIDVEQFWISVGMFAIPATYLAITLLAIRAVKLARCNVIGHIGESTSWIDSVRVASPAVQRNQEHSATFSHPAKVSAFRTLLKYDLAKFSGLGAKIVFGGWTLVVLFWSMVDGASTASIVGLTVTLMFPAIFLNEWTVSSLDQRFLPNLLALAPVRSSSLVWTRQMFFTTTWFASLLGIPIVLTIWHLTGASRGVALAWNDSIETHFGVPNSAFRVSLAIAIIGMLLVARQTTWTVAAIATGRLRWGLWAVAAKFGVAFVVFSWLLYHFMQFPNWEAWNAWAWQGIAQIPTVLPWLLAVKIAIVVIAATMLLRSGLTKQTTVFAVVAAIAAITLIFATALWKLLPGDNVMYWHCAATSALLMPASRILVAPICLAFNRHQ